MVAVLALLGVAVGPLRANAPNAPAAAPAAEDRSVAPTAPTLQAEEDDLPAAPELARALRESVEERLGHTVPASDSFAEVVDSIAEVAELSAVVVSLPEPRHGHQGRYFDQAIDALRRGARVHGYDQLSALLPSGPDHGHEAEEPSAAPCAGCGCGGCEQPEPEPEAEPYFLLFGHGDALLVCILTLESPVRGPAAGDFSRALGMVRHLGRADPGVRLLAPFFSGSAQALGVQMEKFQAAAAERSHFDVITGTATGEDIGKLIDLHLGASFRRTTPNDAAVIGFLLEELEARHQSWLRPWLGRPKIALLSEFDTAFGQAIKPEGESGSPGKKPPSFDTFRFPSSISTIRQVRQQQQKRTEDGKSDDPLSLRRTLQLDLATTEEADGDVPSLLSQITPFERELELGEQLTRICRERYDYLILTATDPLDNIFIAEEARKYCPGLTLIALGAEKLFRHPDVRSTLDGLLIVGSYPLLFEVPPWGNRAERPFSSHVVQGFYNAWLTFLNEAHPTRRTPLLDYRGLADSPSCKSPHGQPLWLTGLAGGSFWPLRTGCATSQEAVVDLASLGPAAPPPRPLTARVTGVVRAAGLLLLAAALAQVLWMRRPSMLDLRRDLLGARYRFGANLTLFLLLGLVLPSMVQAPADPGAVPWVRTIYRLAVIPVVGLWIALARDWVGDARSLFFIQQLRRRAAWQARVRAASMSVLTLLLFASAFVLLSTAWVIHLFWLPNLLLQTVLTRMYNPVGMSPLAPLAYLALAYYLWSFIGLSRARLLIRFSELGPLPLRGEVLDAGGEISSSGSTLTPALGDVVSNLRGAWSGSLWRYELLGAGLAAVPGAYFCLRVRPTWEGAAYDWLLKLALIVLYGLVVVASVHFLTLVSLLRRFLRQLAALPMVDSYDRVAMKMKSSFGINFGVRVPAFEELQLSGYSSTLLERLMAAELPQTALTQSGQAGARVLDPESQRVGRASDSDSPGPDVPVPEHDEGLPAAYRKVFEHMHGAFEPRSFEVTEALRAFRRAEGGAADIEKRGHQALYGASRVLFVILRKFWALRARVPLTEKLGLVGRDVLPGGDFADVPSVALYSAAVPDRVLLWMRIAEDFVTLRIATFLSHVMTHLRYLLTFTLSGSLLLILAVSAYPLEPTRFVTVFSWTLMLGVIALAFTVIVRMERNEVLSRLSGSTPGQVDFNFALAGQLVVYVGLPLLAVFANIFPELRDQLFAWLGPMRRLLP